MMKKTWSKILIILVLISIGLGCVLFPMLGTANAPQSLGSVRVNIETYRAGKNQPTHPSAVVFPEPWNGARYWLAYSPYPYGNGEEENPCLAVSDDLLYWSCPAGLANPIADNEETGCDELKDPHLLYREDLDRLEMWYLGRLSAQLGGDGTSLLLMRKYSNDGIHWSSYEVMSPTQYLSPSIIWDGTKYRMWAIGYDLWNTAGTIVYQESPDGMNWTAPVNCDLGGKRSGIDIWHGSVTFHNGAYHLVFVDNTDRQEIFYCTGSDAVHFSEPEVIIENQGFWNFLYRPTLVYTGQETTCLYGVVNAENQWYLSMSAGTDVHELTGVTERQATQMCALPDDVVDTHSVRYHVKNLYDAVHTYLRLELLALAVLEAGLLILIPPLRKKRAPAWFACVNCLVSLAYVFIRLEPATYVRRLGAVIAVCILNIGMWAVLRCIHASFHTDIQ